MNKKKQLKIINQLNVICFGHKNEVNFKKIRLDN